MRAGEFIVETTEEDRAIVSLASALFKKLQQYADQKIFIAKIDDLVDTPLDALKNTRILLIDQERLNLLSKEHPDITAVGLWIPDKNTIALDIDQLNSKQVKIKLSHELRHALDDIKSDYKAGASFRYNTPLKKDSSIDVYKSEPAEINARFAEVLHRMTLYVEYAKLKNIPNPKQYLIDRFYEMLDKKDISKYFPEKERSKAYKQLIKRGINFIDKEIAHIFGKM